LNFLNYFSPLKPEAEAATRAAMDMAQWRNSMHEA
jgi:hypothetical protein